MATAYRASLLDVMKKNLSIPGYQRPYKWNKGNVLRLLDDLMEAKKEEKDHQDYHYRLGSVILHEDGESFDIVDGQQRLLTLSLFFRCLDDKYENSLLNEEYKDPISINNIKNNFGYIKEWSKRNKGVGVSSFSFLEVIVIEVEKVEEAFTLFDSQNNRGLKLDPHDLLKAHHLREMDVGEEEKKRIVTNFEALEVDKVREIYSSYLYPIRCYLDEETPSSFSLSSIEMFKGIPKSMEHRYASVPKKTMGIFQIDQEFLLGTHFFKMTHHYIEMLEKVKEEAMSIKKIEEIIKGDNSPKTGFNHALRLFHQSLLYLHDRFSPIDEEHKEAIIKKLFAFSMMVRVDFKSLGQATVNNYALGKSENDKFTNRKAIFKLISKAKSPKEILSLEIVTKNDKTNYPKLRDALESLLEE